MEKVFAGLASDRKLEIRGYGGGDVDLVVRAPSGLPYGISIAHKEIPSLMLALGEAAGVVPKGNSWSEGGTPEHLAHILSHLKQYIEAHETIAAQAEETAKLEAEALELCNVVVTSWGNPPYPSVQHMEKETLNRWIAVARKARELGN